MPNALPALQQTSLNLAQYLGRTIGPQLDLADGFVMMTATSVRLNYLASNLHERGDSVDGLHYFMSQFATALAWELPQPATQEADPLSLLAGLEPQLQRIMDTMHAPDAYRWLYAKLNRFANAVRHRVPRSRPYPPPTCGSYAITIICSWSN